MPPEYQQALIDLVRPVVNRDLKSPGPQLRALAEQNRQILEEAQRQLDASRIAAE